MTVRSTALACMMAIVASSVAPAEESHEREWRAACTHDALVHCTGQALTGDRSGVRDCLVQRIDKISARCRDVINAATAEGLPTIDAPASPDSGGRSAASDKTPGTYH